MGKTTLVILAAGMGSRYGGGIKQLEQVGPNGEIILEYSLHDAIAAGFDKVVFVIRRELQEEFDKIIRPEIKERIEIQYAYQELTKVPEGYAVPEGRKKPWGTGHAVLVSREFVKEPFAVINADDFYGKVSFQVLHDYLAQLPKESEKLPFCMVGFRMGNTLSDHGTVKRGYCTADENGKLLKIEEMYDVMLEKDKITAHNEAGEPFVLAPDSIASMSMWGFVPGFYNELDELFTSFFRNSTADPLTMELNLPWTVDEAIRTQKAEVTVLHSPDKWFGVTYHADKENVVKSLARLHAQGVYPEKLF